MGALSALLLASLVLLILSEPLYITARKSRGVCIEFHLVFFMLRLSSMHGKKQSTKKNQKTKISPSTILKTWLKLRKRVKIRIDALCLPFRFSPYTEALLSGLYPPLARGNDLFDKDDDTSLLVHVETTLLDALYFYLRCRHYEKIKLRG